MYIYPFRLLFSFFTFDVCIHYISHVTLSAAPTIYICPSSFYHSHFCFPNPPPHHIHLFLFFLATSTQIYIVTKKIGVGLISMENYSMLFPCPNSSSYPISTSAVGSSQHGFGGQSSNAFLGLRPSNEGSDREEKRVEAGGRDGMLSQISGGSINVTDQLGGSGNNKKKGEKKVRKPRYAFQTRSQVDILDDGYRWRKYGQKAVKNNKFPRSYYRCTHQGCNVKKQVQRLTKDEGVVVTTYEGVHTHPIEKTTDNFEHILNQMQIYTPF
ncbi:WRKY transcription factor 75 [Spatholobus suberectus]|nr:WRKY transcription factor 75 [Spatholobus suberectus]